MGSMLLQQVMEAYVCGRCFKNARISQGSCGNKPWIYHNGLILAHHWHVNIDMRCDVWRHHATAFHSIFSNRWHGFIAVVHDIGVVLVMCGNVSVCRLGIYKAIDIKHAQGWGDRVVEGGDVMTVCTYCCERRWSDSWRGVDWKHEVWRCSQSKRVHTRQQQLHTIRTFLLITTFRLLI